MPGGETRGRRGPDRLAAPLSFAVRLRWRRPAAGLPRARLGAKRPGHDNVQQASRRPLAQFLRPRAGQDPEGLGNKKGA